MATSHNISNKLFYTNITFKKALTLQTGIYLYIKYDKQDQQGKAGFNARNPHTIKQQEPVARRPGRPKQKQDRAQGQAYIRIFCDTLVDLFTLYLTKLTLNQSKAHLKTEIKKNVLNSVNHIAT
jgi:hypothetical protein